MQHPILNDTCAPTIVPPLPGSQEKQHICLNFLYIPPLTNYDFATKIKSPRGTPREHFGLPASAPGGVVK